jgi:RsiW-degrading membrane proteinase PrsW (M82 family)
MPIAVRCSKCGKLLRAPDSMEGKSARCPSCKATVVIHARAAASPAGDLKNAIPSTTRDPPDIATQRTNPPSDDDDFEYKLAPVEPPTLAVTAPTQELLAATGMAAPLSSKRPVVARPPKATKTASQLAQEARLLHQGLERRSVRRFLYVLFLLTLCPLVFSVIGKDDTVERIARTLSAHPELESAEIESKAALFQQLPDQRIEGAHLAFFTSAHWLYAAISAGAFFGLMLLCFDLGRAKVWQLAIVAAATATVGIMFLFMVQWIAAFTEGRLLIGRNLIVMLIFYVAKFIAFSYSAALDPAYGFWMSFFGFTFGVGLCEELTKALPILIMARTDAELDWRGAAVWGLASGIGFGVAEGIHYASDQYNGVVTADVYVVRFVSCVALHAMWAAAVGIMIARCRDEMQQDWEWTDLLMAILKVQAVPMVLHGLYDVMLKKELEGLALGVAALSFVWLAILIEWCRREEAGMMARNAARWATRVAN